jgi:hypothetical protein
LRGKKLSKTYRIQEFAELTGVTVKALHHYDRLGLLKPQRALSGYRLYVERDLERLEQILALKFLGFPLQRNQNSAGSGSFEAAGGFAHAASGAGRKAEAAGSRDEGDCRC